jgi:hypothetical protein
MIEQFIHYVNHWKVSCSGKDCIETVTFKGVDFLETLRLFEKNTAWTFEDRRSNPFSDEVKLSDFIPRCPFHKRMTPEEQLKYDVDKVISEGLVPLLITDKPIEKIPGEIIYKSDIVIAEGKIAKTRGLHRIVKY